MISFKVAFIPLAFLLLNSVGDLPKDRAKTFLFEPCEIPHNEPSLFQEAEIVVDYWSTPILGNGYTAFKEAVAFKESRGDYRCVNKFGYLGKYQFNQSTLHLIGISSSHTFLEHPELQEKAFLANTIRNKWVLRKYIKRYSGTYVNGIRITESGIIAAAHLAGPGSVKKYLISNGDFNKSDAFGTNLSYYLKKFSDYNLQDLPAKQRPKAHQL
jgi:hypothetical protein